nr:MAG TPA: hypothetical protein [Caudoviricetes sp.]
MPHDPCIQAVFQQSGSRQDRTGQLGLGVIQV